MKLQIMILASAMLTIIGPAAGVVYSQCQLGRVLPLCGLNFYIDNWACIALSASGGNTGVWNGPDTNGSYTFGLFQIRSGNWCGLTGPGGACNIPCFNFLDNNITDDCACAKQIFAQHAFSAWNVWQPNCPAEPRVSPC